MKIDLEKIEYIANLSRIYLPKDRGEYFAGQLDMILDYMDTLNKLEVKDIPPTSHVISVENVFREDKITPSLDHHDAMHNAPEKKGRFFKVPKIIGS